MTVLSPDYAQFTIEDRILTPGTRMKVKLKSIPFPDLKGKSVLDIGCDYGQFSYYCALQGAKVLGLDRNREVKGVGRVDLIESNKKVAKRENLDCDFKNINLGEQWFEYGKFDHILMFSMYHHVYENCHDHLPIWFWLWKHCNESVIWENPVDLSDTVSNKHVSDRENYTEEKILAAASVYFDYEFIGPAGHEPHRKVYIFRPKKIPETRYRAIPVSGAGGASKAFTHEENRRINELQNILGFYPYPGSLNMVLDKNFDWSKGYYRAKLLDVVDRSKGLNSTWSKRWVRLYPVEMYSKCFALRFEGETYNERFIELISHDRLRDYVGGECTLCA